MDSWRDRAERPAHGRRALVTGAAICCAAAWIGGAFFGFGAPVAHGSAWALWIMAFVAAIRTAGLFGVRDRAELLLRTGLLVVALVVLCGLLFGAIGVLSLRLVAVAEAVVFVWALVAPPPASLTPMRAPAPILGLWIAAAATVLGTGLSHSPFTAYDSLSYHLYFPARWLQAHRVTIVPTPFGDEAQAYQPSNGELWFLWLMLPFHGDFLARIGQYPFYLLAAVALYALARRMGASSAHAFYAPTFFLVAPPVVEQAVGANVDLIHATLFLTSLHLGIAAADSDRRRDWALWGVSVGLFLGTKYLATIYLPLLLGAAVVRGVRRHALWALPGLAVWGLPWYIRNWVVAGSPLYPLTIRIAGVMLGAGAYSRDAMTRSFLHTSDPRLLAISLVHAYGPTLFVIIAPALVLAAANVARRRLWWPAGYVLAVVLAGPALCWATIGDNADSRFLLPSVIASLGLLPLAFVQGRGRTLGVHLLYGAGLAWIIVGADARLAAGPWFMADWLSMRGVVARQYVAAFAAAAASAALVCAMASRRVHIGPVAAALTAAAGIAAAIGAETWCVPSRCDFLQIASPHLRLNYLYGARWLVAHVSGAAVAYTGINLPYPLTGSHLQNTVFYVNIDGHGEWRFHDYACWSRTASARDGSDALASPSGLLMPAAPARGTVIDALRPRFERMRGDAAAWRSNLRARGIRYVFISTLDPYEIEYVWHNSRGFPVEAEWAAASPEFRLVYENPDVRIFEVAAP